MKPGDRVKMSPHGYETFPHPRTIRSGVVERVTPQDLLCVRISKSTAKLYHPDYWELASDESSTGG